jgi:uncharacterized protein
MAAYLLVKPLIGKAMRLLKMFIISWLLAVIQVQASDLMQANLVVADHSHQALVKVLPKALKMVLVKISGNPSVMTLPDVENQMQHISDMVKSYTYSYQSDPSSNDEVQQLVAHVTFDHKAITELLNKSGQPVWSKDRPKTLVWLQMDSDQGPSFVTSTDTLSSPLATSLVQSAADRGLNLLFPIDDLTDQSVYPVGGSQLFDVDQIEMVSKRYGVDSVLVGKVTSAPGGWQAHWTYVLNGAPVDWTDSQMHLDDLVSNVISTVADDMVSQLAMDAVDDTKSSVLLEVTGVSDLSQYAKVQNYLKTLKLVNQVSLKGVTSTGMMLEVDYQGGLDQLEHRIAQGSQLEVQHASVSDAASGHAVLTYHWQGA